LAKLVNEPLIVSPNAIGSLMNSRVTDQSSRNGLSNQSGQVGRNNVHLLNQVSSETLPVLGELDNTFGKGTDVDQIDLVDVTAHTGTSGVQYVSCSGFVIIEDLLHGWQRLLGKGGTVTDGDSKKTVLVCVGNELVKLGEVPSVPFSNSHGESVEILVELVGKGDGLDDHVVTSVDVEL
jgi:hypothetical protein